MHCRDCHRFDPKNRKCLDRKINPLKWVDAVEVANVMGIRAICIYNDHRERLARSRGMPVREDDHNEAMQDSGLYRLYRLSQVDAELHRLKRQAAGLDLGQEDAQEYKRIAAESKEIRDRFKALRTEQKDTELKIESLNAKKDHFEKQLFGGSISNAKEAENVQKEINMLKGLISEAETRLLELMDEIPPVEAEASVEQKKLDEIKVGIEAKREQAKARHAELKKVYKETAAQRPDLEKAVPEQILKEYENVRKRVGDPAIAVVTEATRCSGCGVPVPEKVLERLRNDLLTRCESCHRILFWVVPEA